jgi:hypothetical protein
MIFERRMPVFIKQQYTKHILLLNPKIHGNIIQNFNFSPSRNTVILPFKESIISGK